MINFINEDINYALENVESITQWISEIVTLHEKVVAELNFYFCSDEYILKLNNKVLAHDFYTDIITFDNCIDNLVMGEIYISTERVSENEKSFSDGKYPEILRVIIHGVLHLLGYNDHSDAEKTKMRIHENNALDIYFSR